MLKLPKPLSSKAVFNPVKKSDLNFKTTKGLKPSDEIISQKRAVNAIHFGLSMTKPGYNIYISGIEGTGKTSVIKNFLEEYARKSKKACDWVYVHDFEMENNAKAMSLPSGMGQRLKKDLDNIIRDLCVEIPLALTSEDYENRVNNYFSQHNEEQTEAFHKLEEHARKLDFMVKSTQLGIETIPVVDGRVLNDREYSKLSMAKKAQIEARRAKVEPKVLAFARKVRQMDIEARQYVSDLQKQFVTKLLDNILSEVYQYYKDKAEILKHLEKIKNDVLENIKHFVDDGDKDSKEVSFIEQDRFKKYRINLYVDNRNLSGAPIVIETNPTYYNLFGKIQRNINQGVFQTDHTLIEAGCVHKANGGYLVIDAKDILTQPYVWEMLKKNLRNRKAYVEDIGDQLAPIPTLTLYPEPIPLDLKVILVGTEEIYRYLCELDESFNKIFKVKAEFDYKMPRSKPTMQSYATFIATRCIKEGLKPFNSEAVASVIEFSSRLVEDQNYLSTQFSEIKDLVLESEFFCIQERKNVVDRKHVEAAVASKYMRLNLIEERILELLQNDDIMIDLHGEKIGQINGLTVYDLGDYSFGRPIKISCNTFVSTSPFFNIERASRLSGKIHDKGFYIVESIVNFLLASQYSLNMSACVSFEQSYDEVDGDSASLAELIAIFSSLAQIPIKQNFAITGSMSQSGEVQPIGGVNEKIEGFVRCAELSKKTKSCAVIIPQKNVKNLMLNAHTRKKIDDGFLQIYPVSHLWEAFELLTEVSLGVRDLSNIAFESDSALDLIQKRLSLIRNAKKEDKKGNTD